jgi:hypothetical protein
LGPPIPTRRSARSRSHALAATASRRDRRTLAAMARRVSGAVVMPLSKDPRARSRQLANLRRGDTKPTGNQSARTHGGYARVVLDRLEERERLIFEALAEDAPLRDENGNLPRRDAVAVRLLAQCLCRLEDVSANVNVYGVLEQRGKRKGQIRPAVELEARLRVEAREHCAGLGMSPAACARLGVDVARVANATQSLGMIEAELTGEVVAEDGASG